MKKRKKELTWIAFDLLILFLGLCGLAWAVTTARWLPAVIWLATVVIAATGTVLCIKGYIRLRAIDEAQEIIDQAMLHLNYHNDDLTEDPMEYRVDPGKLTADELHDLMKTGVTIRHVDFRKYAPLDKNLDAMRGEAENDD